ncbi:uncharacterized protein BJ212DRAFT_1308406 [Suillus subaureus]|uniref:Uncharacterized protein n=1 Tax=Suillus subaureus TaxID=48587 RepID=A0A9P7APL8_9AGAM|nr:uncharacterized protein BJ212DRAFT_1416476 [Suillus subaureus]XP_041199656.1 uncharacterized protein BJ212DRAFT_1308406 [Suillus subaureus]KAG1793012.1 hypothetical protein BJ212DRAFT_1416476 [Suillus subaureus]KAG1826809.1 hypothetical protein BJ212DRAFT_1308406 [Suillus subaureus]
MPVDIRLHTVISCQLIGRWGFVQADGQDGQRWAIQPCIHVKNLSLASSEKS